MKEIFQTSQFKKDYKRAKKRGKDLEKLKYVVGLIIDESRVVKRCQQPTDLSYEAVQRIYEVHCVGFCSSDQ